MTTICGRGAGAIGAEDATAALADTETSGAAVAVAVVTGGGAGGSVPPAHAPSTADVTTTAAFEDQVPTQSGYRVSSEPVSPSFETLRGCAPGEQPAFQAVHDGFESPHPLQTSAQGQPLLVLSASKDHPGRAKMLGLVVSPRRSALVLVLGSLVATAGCGEPQPPAAPVEVVVSATPPPASATASPSAVESTSAQPEPPPFTIPATPVEHQACDVDGPGVDRLDMNKDGKPDVLVVKKNGKEACRAMDADFDGKPDIYKFTDDAGKLVRLEHDFDADGKVDHVVERAGPSHCLDLTDSDGDGRANVVKRISPCNDKLENGP